MQSRLMSQQLVSQQQTRFDIETLKDLTTTIENDVRQHVETINNQAGAPVGVSTFAATDYRKTISGRDNLDDDRDDDIDDLKRD